MTTICRELGKAISDFGLKWSYMIYTVAEGRLFFKNYFIGPYISDG